MSCINSFPSNLLLASCSDRSLAVFDLAAGRVAQRLEDIHPRPAHTVRLPTASHNSDVGTPSLHNFLTSSLGGSIMVRSPAAVVASPLVLPNTASPTFHHSAVNRCGTFAHAGQCNDSRATSILSMQYDVPLALV